MDGQTDDQVSRDMDSDRKRRARLEECQRRFEWWMLKMLREGRPVYDKHSGAPTLGEDGKQIVQPPTVSDLRTAANYLIECGLPKGRLMSASRVALAEVLRRVQESNRGGDPFVDDEAAPELDQ